MIQLPMTNFQMAHGRGVIWEGPHVRTQVRTVDQGAEQSDSTREMPANVAAMQSAEFMVNLDPIRPGFFFLQRLRNQFAASLTRATSSSTDGTPSASQSNASPRVAPTPDEPMPLTFDGNNDQCAYCCYDFVDGADVLEK